MSVKILTGDVRDMLKTLPDESVHCVVTSPPYWGLRDYGVEGQIGMEPTMGEHIDTMVAVFREVRRVLRKDGTCWVNYGDCYNASPGQRKETDAAGPKQQTNGASTATPSRSDVALKPKDLCMIPNRLAIALQEPYYTGQIKRLEDRVWLAAMVDAEGCMFIHKRKAGQSNGQGYERKSDSYATGMEVANTSEAVVQRCMEIAGVGSICRQDKDRRQPLFRWNLRSNQCREIIKEIYPHLVAKQHEARLMLGCPSSGAKAHAAHQGVIALHNGQNPDIDYPPPASLFEPGWFVRSEVVWKKPNPMPESVTDRPATAHEKVWLLSKSARYFYDAEAVRTASTWNPDKTKMPDGWDTGPGAHGTVHRNGREKGAKTDKQRGHGRRHDGFNDRWDAMPKAEQQANGANLRNVWTIATAPFKEAHFATFPPALAETCIKAGCPAGGTVLDPFGGSGTTGMVADRLGRDAILIELNPNYADMARNRINKDAGMFAEVS